MISPRPFSLFKCKLVLACFEWKYLLCPLVLGGWYWAGMSFVTPERCSSDVVFLHQDVSWKIWWFTEVGLFFLTCFNFVFKQCLLKEPSESLGIGFVFRLVEGQTLPLIAGFSKCLPRVSVLASLQSGWVGSPVFLSPQPVIPIQGEVAASAAATSVQRSRVCGCACAGVCECGRCAQSLQAHQVRSGQRKEQETPI